MVKKLSILLIEDNPLDERLVKEYVELSKSISFEITTAATLKEGIEKLSSNSFDVILLDLNLPDSFGLETFEKLLDNVNGTPIILLTGINDEKIAVHAIQRGAQDYLNKNQINEVTLTRAIQYSVERKKAELEIKKSADYWNKTFDAIADAIVILDADQGVIISNNAFQSLVNENKNAVICKKCYGLFHNSEEPIHNCPFVRMYKTMKRESIELEIDGCYFNVTVDPIFNDNGNISGAVHIMTNITERKKIELELKTLTNSLEQKVEEQTKELKGKIRELENFKEITLNREYRIAELKKEIKKLKELES